MELSVRVQTEWVEEWELFYEVYNKKTGLAVSSYFRTEESAYAELVAMSNEL